MGHKHSVTENPVEVVGIAAIAAAIGAAVAMLFTPRSGDQVRRGIGRRANHLQDEVRHRFDHSSDNASDAADSIKDRLQSTATKVVKDTKSTAEKVKSDAKATKSDTEDIRDEVTKPRSNGPLSQ